MHLKPFKNETFEKIAEATSDLIGNKVDDDYAHGYLSAACFFVPHHKKSFIFAL